MLKGSKLMFEKIGAVVTKIHPKSIAPLGMYVAVKRFTLFFVKNNLLLLQYFIKLFNYFSPTGAQKENHLIVKVNFVGVVVF